MSADKVRYELRDTVAVITLDDGKANALSYDMMAAITERLDRAEREARAVLLMGRDRRLSAGFDLSVMTTGPDAVRQMVGTGAELLLRIYTFPRPVVVGCTGHALAAGAIILLAGDWRVGAAGDFKIGLNEVAIRLTLPAFAMEMARDRLSKRYFNAATLLAQVFDANGAKDAGYLDEVVPAAQLFDTALAQALRLAALPDPAFPETKLRQRGAVARHIRHTLAEDLESLTMVVGAS